ncbi:MAG: FAD-dependent oxidoreductase [Geminicoccaceae bacterium]
MGLIGYGQIGTRVVKLLLPFGCRILVADPYKTLAPEDAAAGVVMTDLADLLARADVVSLHARVTEETRGFLAAPQFAAMKRGGWFINTHRPRAMVNYPDLCTALRSGHLRSAMLGALAGPPPPVPAAPAPQRHLTRTSPAPRRPPCASPPPWSPRRSAAGARASPSSTLLMEPFCRPAEQVIDLLVIGGGIGSASIAEDAAGRGLLIALRMEDLAWGTSSRSGKLVHGGLRYLEYYEFRLVREALIEREVLLAAAPHIIWPMRFVLPHSPEQRPAWPDRLGLFSTTTWAAASACRRPVPWTSEARRKVPRSADLHPRLRIFRLLGRRCPPRAAQRPGRARARSERSDPHRLHRRKA